MNRVKSIEGVGFCYMVGITFLSLEIRWEMNEDFEKFISGNWKAEGKYTAWFNFFFG